MLDSCPVGNVFEGPNVDSCIDAIKLAEGGAGVLRLYGNYGGDRMNFDMAGASPGESEKRRGVAGIIYA